MVTISDTQIRIATLEKPVVAESSDTLVLSFASVYPVERNGYVEVLDLDGGDRRRVDLGSVPWLWRHDEDQVLGQVEAVWRSLNKLYCRVKWGQGDAVDKFRPVIESGTVGTSCRYRVSDYKEQERNGQTVVTITDWELIEVSSLPVPADPTVGVGRNFSQTTGENSMPSAARIERGRVKLIQAMGEKYGPKLPGGANRALELVEQAIENDLGEQAARALFADEILGAARQQESISRPLPQVDGRGFFGGHLGMTQRDQDSYSIARAIKATVEGNWKGAEFELEAHEALEKQGFRSNGVLVPMEALRAPMLTSTPSQAGNLIGTKHLSGSFIDALRASTFIYELGCARMDGLVGNVQIPRQASVSSLGWIAENTDLPESAPSFDKITLTPKTVGAWTTMSRLMATQADPAVESLILSDFRNSLARELARTAIHGSGAGGQPTGILNTPGIGSVVKGANGGALTWDDILALEREVEADNALGGSLGFVTSTRLKAKLKGTLKSATAGADYIWMDSANADGTGIMSGYRALSSTTIRSDLTKGTGTNLSALVFGDWSSLIVATWGALSLEVDPNHDFRKGTIAMRVMLFADMAVRHPESFAACTDATTT
jgi:HK97 family phage major capsid protein